MSAGHGAGFAPPQFTAGEVFRRHGDAYRARYAITRQQSKALWCIAHCRTAVMGGHLDACDDCDWQQPAYNSCRNRHCPKCQGAAQAEWLAAREERLLPVPYFHVVMTLPSELRPLARANPREVYGLLLRSANGTLLELARDPKWMGGIPGITSVLHTWSRDLRLHPHVHSVVTGGGLSLDGTRWVSRGEGRLLFPVKVIGRLFRGKMLAGLAALREAGELRGVDDPLAFAGLKDRLYRKDWVVYAKRPFAGAEQVFSYLGRYTHRVGLSDYRLLDVTADAVTWKTRGDGTATVAPVEFIRRLLQHVLPKGFVKIRHAGLYAAGNVNTRLARARALLADEPPPVVERTVDLEAIIAELIEMPSGGCPACGGRLTSRPLPAAGAASSRAPPLAGPP